MREDESNAQSAGNAEREREGDCDFRRLQSASRGPVISILSSDGQTDTEERADRHYYVFYNSPIFTKIPDI